MSSARPKARSTLPVTHVTLEQWRCLVAVVDAGSHEKAAALLHKSQSSVTYAVRKIEKQLAVQAFRIDGRRAVLTPAGTQLYRRALALLEDAAGIELAAARSSAGWEAEIGLAVEILYPTWLLLDCLAEFGRESPQTRIELFESVMEGTPELMRTGTVDLAIATSIPTGLHGEPLMRVRFVPVAHPDHPLHALGRPLTPRDLRKHRHLTVRDTGSRRDKRVPTIEAEQRWTVSNMTTSIGAAVRGHGFAWFPEEKIRAEIERGQLRILPLQDSGERYAQLHLVWRDDCGPGVERLLQILRGRSAANADRA